MSIFSRMSDIIQANINAILDKAEDPHKVLRLVIQEMEETLVEVRTSAAGYIADQKQLSRQIDKYQSQSNDWQEKAQLALDKNREDLARAALVEKQECDSKVSSLQADYERVQESLNNLSEDTQRLQNKLTEAKKREKQLAMKADIAVSRVKVKEQEHAHDINRGIEKLAAFERKIDELESQIEAYDFAETKSLKDQFEQMANDEKVDAELAKLKAKKAA